MENLMQLQVINSCVSLSQLSDFMPCTQTNYAALFHRELFLLYWCIRIINLHAFHIRRYYFRTLFLECS